MTRKVSTAGLAVLIGLNGCSTITDSPPPTASTPVVRTGEAARPIVSQPTPLSPEAFADRCAGLLATDLAWPDASTVVTSAVIKPASATVIVLPEHCEIVGAMARRTGAGGQTYQIGFHIRLPRDWNGRFLFQGGSGSNGEIGDALGGLAPGAPPALARGYAVVSQDSGHDNRTNTDPAKGGAVAFGFDPQARADYGGASLKSTTDVAKAAIRFVYEAEPSFSYFVGCSKGGQEGMAVAHRWPDAFDGVVAAAPGFALPRAAVAEAWDTQTFMALAPAGATNAAALAATFSSADLALVRDAVLDACDDLDGVDDGLVAAFAQCTTARVRPKLDVRTCRDAEADDCVTPAQIQALERSIGGPKTSAGKPLYSDWAWDAGIAAPGWRMWKLGDPSMRPPALNVILGLPSLAAVFSTPPRGLGGMDEAIAYALAYDFDRDASAIYATDGDFRQSAWDMVSARSPDLDAFRARGGRMIVPHGVSDPVFSINDTLTWFGEVDSRTHGEADTFVRVFPVPGMNHCNGGPATDQFDAFTSLVAWVEKGTPPDAIVARSGDNTPWPGRTRPLCPYPAIARYDGEGDIEAASSFHCERPAA